MPLEAIKGLAELVSQEVGFCQDDEGGAQIEANFNRLGYIHGQLTGVDDGIDTIDAKLDRHMEDLNQHVMDFNEWKVFSLRTRIEINLAGHGKHPHEIAMFQLPEQFGGHLELAREVVEETLVNMMAAGESINNAEKKLAQGDLRYAAGEYKRAYVGYGEAYRAATKPTGEGGH
jgi:hypothetical protein